VKDLMMKGKYIGAGLYEYQCENCGKKFISDIDHVFGLDKLCEECFEGYCDMMYCEGKELDE